MNQMAMQVLKYNSEGHIIQETRITLINLWSWIKDILSGLKWRITFWIKEATYKTCSCSHEAT